MREREREKSRVCNSILRQENVISALAAAATCRQLGELEQPANALSVLTKISIKKKDSEILDYFYTSVLACAALF